MMFSLLDWYEKLIVDFLINNKKIIKLPILGVRGGQYFQMNIKILVKISLISDENFKLFSTSFPHQNPLQTRLMWNTLYSIKEGN
jgi:hypothetical protein